MSQMLDIVANGVKYIPASVIESDNERTHYIPSQPEPQTIGEQIEVEEHVRTHRTPGQIIHIAGIIAKYLKYRRQECSGWGTVELISEHLISKEINMDVKQVSSFMKTAKNKNEHIERLFKNAYVYKN